MKPFVGLLGLLLLLSFMKTCADDWSAIHLQCANYWFQLRIKPTIFHNIFMDPDEVFLGIGCPVTTVWPNDIYEFIYRTYSCGIVNKVLCDVTLLQTKLTYISKNASLQAEMSLSCVMHSQSPHVCEAESRGDFTGDPPEWTVDMRARRDEQTVTTVPSNLSTSSEDHQVSKEPQASETSRSEAAEVPSFMDQNF
ncbi:oocyte-secreted protein 1 [Mus caroli]|uniref:Oocyte-secreted protein 1 n=1 Tax=Mus caroli TaxID=10089 RepID=A0A6P5P0Q9_MUSCR|nr:oocyte-secreted protein 1 [Mus caroli]